jgi:hypothetical protein
MSTMSNIKVARIDKPSFNSTRPMEYGDFMERACAINSCLDQLEGHFHMVTEEEALKHQGALDAIRNRTEPRSESEALKPHKTPAPRNTIFLNTQKIYYRQPYPDISRYVQTYPDIHNHISPVYVRTYSVVFYCHMSRHIQKYPAEYM